MHPPLIIQQAQIRRPSRLSVAQNGGKGAFATEDFADHFRVWARAGGEGDEQPDVERSEEDAVDAEEVPVEEEDRVRHHALFFVCVALYVDVLRERRKLRGEQGREGRQDLYV